MKNTWLLFVGVILLVGCKPKDIELNDITETFQSFQETDSLTFVAMADEVIHEPMKMIWLKDHLILRGNVLPGDSFLIDYSLKENKVVSKGIRKGEGPEELLNCDIVLHGDDLWLYDSGKQKVCKLVADSVLSGNYAMNQCHKVLPCYYSVELLNDSVLLGTNDLTSRYKLAYLNLNSGETKSQALYSYLNEHIPLSALIDAGSCYINVHPHSKDIALSYRYTDVLEIYNQHGELKNSVQGPACFDVSFSVRSNRSMEKTNKTRKAFVNNYVTDNYIYLLYSGCGRADKNWSYGTELFIYSWNGKPLKRYVLEQPIYAFAINDSDSELYTYSLQTGELMKATIATQAADKK